MSKQATNLTVPIIERHILINKKLVISLEILFGVILISIFFFAYNDTGLMVIPKIYQSKYSSEDHY